MQEKLLTWLSSHDSIEPRKTRVPMWCELREQHGDDTSKKDAIECTSPANRGHRRAEAGQTVEIKEICSGETYPSGEPG